VVRRVTPALIDEGRYTWPWLGVTGGDVNLIIKDANELDTQYGAYIAEVVEDGPAAEAGIQGASGVEEIDGREVPVGGDVIIKANGEPAEPSAIKDFDDLLAYVAFKRPGDTVELTILRDGERQQVTVELAARPEEFE
jgi:S1-C subfamily serine protease